MHATAVQGFTILIYHLIIIIIIIFIIFMILIMIQFKTDTKKSAFLTILFFLIIISVCRVDHCPHRVRNSTCYWSNCWLDCFQTSTRRGRGRQIQRTHRRRSLGKLKPVASIEFNNELNIIIPLFLSILRSSRNFQQL